MREYFRKLGREPLDGLIAGLLVACLSLWGCLDLSQDQRPAVQAFYYIMAAAMASSCLLMLFTFFVLDPILIDRWRSKLESEKWRERHPFLSEYVEILKEVHHDGRSQGQHKDEN
jgi:hypothetical protein